jgi:thioredoxin 1
MAELAAVTDAGFEEKILKSDLPVLVDFYGSWCAPCLKMKPMLEEIARELEGRAFVVRAEITEVPESAGRHDVMTVPTLMVFAGGEPRETLTGRPSKAEIMKAMEPYLKA